MGWFILSHVFSTMISSIRIFRLSEQDKALEILLLRQQLDILLRKQNQPVIPNRAEKMSLAILTAKLKEVTGRLTRRLRSILRLF